MNLQKTILALQVWGLGFGLTTQSWKNSLVTETATKEKYYSRVDSRLSEPSTKACMNGSGESRKEATDRNMRELFTAKTRTKIGFWNVRTMYSAGKLAQVTSEMRRYNLDILGISESRWVGAGKIQTSTGETVLYSGREDDQHSEGVAIILKKGKERNLMEWKPINSRLIKIRLRGRHVNVTIIQCYSPTNDSKDEDKDDFYEQLTSELEKAPRHDTKIIMGDLNAKIGCNNSTYERAMGKEGCGVMNENGERLVEFCLSNDLVIGGSLFPHKTIHKLTWYSPNGRDKNQIDHLLINRMWRGSLLDVKVRRSADVGSDHQLVTADIRVKLRAVENTRNMRQRYDIDKLKDPNTSKSFTISLKNKFQVLADLNDEDPINDNIINKEWNIIKNAYLETARTCLGKKSFKKKEWLSQDTWKSIEKRREVKSKILHTKSNRVKERLTTQYQEINRDIKRSARQDKRLFMDCLANEAEEAARTGDQGKVYKIAKQISGHHKGSSDLPVMNKQGELLTADIEKEARWTEHFKEILNRPPPLMEANIEEAESDLDIDIEPPSVEEIIAAIEHLKNGRAPGIDNLNAEYFKADPMFAAKLLQPLFTKIWKEKKTPDEWNKGVIVKIPKKGNLRDCNNWRGVTLLSIPSKILAKIIIKRISNASDEYIRKEQAGFRKGRSCADQIFTLRNVIEQCNEWQRQLFINFIDFEKAFDSLHRESIWKILRHYGIPQHLVQLIKSFYSEFTCQVGSCSQEFDIKTGVRQGCVMSSTIFTLAIDWVMRQTTKDSNTGIRWTLLSSLEDIDFADDLALLAHTHKHMQEKTSKLHSVGQQIGLKINIKKSEVMTLNIQNPAPIIINDQNIRTTEEFTYLGSVVTNTGGAEVDIGKRLNKARHIFRQMNNVWRTDQYSLKTKLKIYQSCVISTLLYGSECWRMTDSDMNKLAVFHTKCLRRIKKIFWPRKISNENLLQECGMEDMRDIIVKRRWRWIGHILRREDGNIARTALHWTPEGRRRRGRPRMTWRRTVENEMKEMGETWGSLKMMATDRERWRSFVAALHTTGVTGSK